MGLSNIKNYCLGLFAVSVTLVSCKKDQRATYLTEEAGIDQPVQSGIAPKVSLFDQAGIQTAQPQSTAVTAPGMNPPHGQPGHRCDIPVGQPLNSKPAQDATQKVTVNPNQGQQTIQIDPNALQPGKFTVDANGKPKAVKTAKGMNPPHGEPGHRCDIPVGQPLNSKPAQNIQPVQTIAQNTPQPATPAPTGEKPALNPPHGEPWHNCAVKVGEALP
ncbi:MULTISPECIES: hypothetical protein [Chryseobacterium]|uniref:Uncharacterized protein n=1 Tax=Chryseobacterium camelliae TaxID=1265445 RepID=A0ABU0TNR7_9FLAO|nr:MULTISPECIES: hypothetical protein [Chryseobacterium]MDT3407702.1 hypothetical protein [Pseudacidovorax intermedius]MDQ1098446.1 hypothetical protein [Chryseobacterium camelliae]MDQ1102370.1 hypothetical protein [Chryseobacterium sp. SORGH_AS_1048]MDR6085807.1 hypothetical protein [Chryseobacterium sp. SORGH_AS_0909]MDR6130170.1 hypothetical protein [Chryseobacterium sp. SORGH_AS_1175]